MAESVVILFQWLVFLGIALVCIFASIMVVSNKNPVHCALWMVLTFLATAGLYVMLHSQFIAIVQVIVYAGAIMMLILFGWLVLKLDYLREVGATMLVTFSAVTCIAAIPGRYNAAGALNDRYEGNDIIGLQTSLND